MTLEGTRFKTPVVARPYHILDLTGAWMAGKTRFALTAPAPIAYQSLDYSTDGVVDSFLEEGKDIRIAEYNVQIDTKADELMRDNKREEGLQAADAQARRITNEVWEPFKRDFMAAIRSPEVRTVVWDTADAVNDVLRLAYYGKTERNAQLGNGLINAEFKSLVKMAADAKKNFVLLHQYADEYREYEDPEKPGRMKSVRTGKLKRRGNQNADYLVQTFVHSVYVPPAQPGGDDPGRWLFTIDKARLNPSATGQVLDSPDWPTLMMVLMPKVNPEVWL